MGQGIGSICCRKPKDADEAGEVVHLCAVHLCEDDSPACIHTLELLRESVDFYRQGQLTDSIRAVKSAEELLKGLVWSSESETLQRAFDTDPECVAIRAKLRAIDEIVVHAADSGQGALQESCSRIARDVRLDRGNIKCPTLMARRIATELGGECGMDEKDVEKHTLASLEAASKSLSTCTGSGNSQTDSLSASSLGKGQVLEKLEQSLQRVLELCRSALVVEAAGALAALEVDVAASFKLCAETYPDMIDPILEFASRLKTDAEINRLTELHDRFVQSMEQTMKPALVDSPKWLFFEAKDAALGNDFRLECKLRAAEGEEYKKGGPATQLIVSVQAFNFPRSLTQLFAMDREVDLLRKEFIGNCEEVHGWTSGAERSFSVLLQAIVKNALLPFRVENVMVRDFSVCREPPLAGQSRSGVLELETSPPTRVRDFLGWQLPPERKGHVRLPGTIRLWYKMPSAEHPDSCCDVVLAVRAGVNVPQWMLPLGLIKNVMSNQVLTTLRLMKKNVVDRWDEIGYDGRIEACPKLYEHVAEMENARPPDPLRTIAGA